MPDNGSVISEGVLKLHSWEGRERGGKIKQGFDLCVLYIILMLLSQMSPSCDCLIGTYLRDCGSVAYHCRQTCCQL